MTMTVPVCFSGNIWWFASIPFIIIAFSNGWNIMILVLFAGSQRPSSPTRTFTRRRCHRLHNINTIPISLIILAVLVVVVVIVNVVFVWVTEPWRLCIIEVREGS
jgi:hypothetical protein